MSNRQLEAEAARDTLEKRTRFMDELTASTAQTYNDTLIRDPNMTRMDKVTREGLAKFFSENQHLRFPWAPVQPLEPLLGRLRHLLSNVTSREGHLGVMWTFLDEHEADLAPLFVLCSGTQVATAKLRALENALFQKRTQGNVYLWFELMYLWYSDTFSDSEREVLRARGGLPVPAKATLHLGDTWGYG